MAYLGLGVDPQPSAASAFLGTAGQQMTGLGQEMSRNAYDQGRLGLAVQQQAQNRDLQHLQLLGSAASMDPNLAGGFVKAIIKMRESQGLGTSDAFTSFLSKLDPEDVPLLFNSPTLKEMLNDPTKTMTRPDAAHMAALNIELSHARAQRDHDLAMKDAQSEDAGITGPGAEAGPKMPEPPNLTHTLFPGLGIPQPQPSQQQGFRTGENGMPDLAQQAGRLRAGGGTGLGNIQMDQELAQLAQQRGSGNGVLPQQNPGLQPPGGPPQGGPPPGGMPQGGPPQGGMPPQGMPQGGPRPMPPQGGSQVPPGTGMLNPQMLQQVQAQQRAAQQGGMQPGGPGGQQRFVPVSPGAGPPGPGQAQTTPGAQGAQAALQNTDARLNQVIQAIREVSTYDTRGNPRVIARQKVVMDGLLADRDQLEKRRAELTKIQMFAPGAQGFNPVTGQWLQPPPPQGSQELPPMRQANEPGFLVSPTRNESSGVVQDKYVPKPGYDAGQEKRIRAWLGRNKLEDNDTNRDMADEALSKRTVQNRFDITNPKLGGNAVEQAVDIMISKGGDFPDGWGRMNQNQKAQVFTRFAEKVKELGETPEGLIARKALNHANQAELTRVSQDRGRLMPFIKLFDDNIKLALDASSKWDRTSIPLINQLLAAGAEKWTGDPAYSRFYLFNLTVVNEYARIMNGVTGITTNEARAHAVRALSTAQSEEQYQAVVKGLMEETHNRVGGFNNYRQELVDNIRRGVPPSGGAQPGGGRPDAQPAQPGVWRLRNAEGQSRPYRPRPGETEPPAGWEIVK